MREISCHLIHLGSNRCLVSHDISLQALVHFLAIPKQPIIKLLEVESSDESSFGIYRLLEYILICI
uniref:Uncharacterized protein n=1 Tax=Strigops habroptila TaxID=2489341 RepID=A0A672UIW0_STRHB